MVHPPEGEVVAVPVETSKKNMKWRGRPPRIFKYVDDNLQINTVNMETAGAKTSMVCVSGAMSYDARSHIFDSEGNRISSGQSMKVLGFHLSSRPTMHAHVGALSKRVRQKYWVLYHLRRAGFTSEELARVYRTCILPILDYCSVVYHPLLTDEMDQAVRSCRPQP